MEHIFTPELKVAASTALIQRGCVHLICLSGLKSETGPRWDKLKDSIWAHMENVLRQKLGATDFYSQVDETSFLVSMPSASAEESQIFCLRIAHQLYSNLLGRCEIGKLEIAQATKVDNDVLYTAPLITEELRLLALKARLEMPSAEESALLEGVPVAGKANPQSRFSHKFVPLWDAQKEAITTYRCISLVDQGVADSLGEPGRIRFDIAMTISRIQRATGELATHLASGDRFLVAIPVSYDVLSSPVGRMEISTVCRSLSAALRPYLIFEINELPLGVPQSRLAELVGSLRPFGRGVATQLAPNIPNFAAYLGAGLHAIGLSLGGNSAERSGEIFKLCAAAKRQGIRSFALDVPNLNLMRNACAQGINLISGPVIGPAQDAPARVRRLALREALQTSDAWRPDVAMAG